MTELKNGLPERIICPVCGGHGESADSSSIPHFWRFQEFRGENSTRWLLGFVCEGHHHWVIELLSQATGILVKQRVVSCPDTKACSWNPANWSQYSH